MALATKAAAVVAAVGLHFRSPYLAALAGKVDFVVAAAVVVAVVAQQRHLLAG